MSSIYNLTGETLGKCQLRELLGMGGMGAVYRGYQTHLGRMVAVKVLSPTLAQEPGYVERFNREAETAATLEHKHIIPIYHYGTEDGISYVVMRLLTGGTLSERMAQANTEQQAPPSLNEVGDLLKQVASALDYAHQQGVVHRDVKPSNIMFDNEGIAYIVDFGIAKLLQMSHSLTQSGISMGTPVYMAPEQWKADELTGAVDQYSLGVLAYQLIAGREPFDAPTPSSLMYQHVHETPKPIHLVRADVPEMVSQVLDRAMAKEPEERFSSVGSFAKAFIAAVQHEPILSTGFFTVPLPPKTPEPDAASLSAEASESAAPEAPAEPEIPLPKFGPPPPPAPSYTPASAYVPPAPPVPAYTAPPSQSFAPPPVAYPPPPPIANANLALWVGIGLIIGSIVMILVLVLSGAL
ncbi:MAG TPA: serine/threonine-protein kinase [Aggregatilineaceae bacterium]|nr:serine/threonine-protein kinase [Aggregatilineaceae bacterium]